MKITAQDFAALTAKVAPFDTAERRADYKSKGLTDKRYRWDLTYVVNSNDINSASRFICDTLYTYMDDSHVDTALRSIVKPL